MLDGLAPLAIEASHDGCAIVDGDGVVLYANPAMHTMLHRQDALEGTPLLSTVHVDDRDHVLATWADADLFGPGRMARCRLGRTDGAYFNVEIAVTRTRGPDGEPLLVCNVRAAHALRSLEATLRHIQRLLEQQEELLGSRQEFVVAVAHQLRTPLAAVVTGCELIGEQLDVLEPERTVEIAHRVRRNAWRMRDTIAQFVRVESGGAEPDGPVRRRFDASHLLGEVVKEVYTDHAPVTIDVRCDSDVVSDREAVADAIRAMLDNAIIHTPPGTPVHLEVDDETDGWTFTVSDEGPGVPDGRRNDIFSPFVTFDVPPFRPTVGLGLHLVDLVARDHGGWARVVPHESGGARFLMHVGSP